MGIKIYISATGVLTWVGLYGILETMGIKRREMAKDLILTGKEQLEALESLNGGIKLYLLPSRMTTTNVDVLLRAQIVKVMENQPNPL